MVRRGELGVLLLGTAVLSWLGSLLVTPYTTWGDPPQIRTNASHAIVNAALICLLLLASSAAVVFWKKENRRGWKAIAFALALLFFGGTALARFIYVQFFVLAQLG